MLRLEVWCWLLLPHSCLRLSLLSLTIQLKAISSRELKMSASLFFTFAVLVSNIFHVSASSVCYDLNQVQDQTTLPCNPDVENGPCCPFGWVCLSNGLCEPSAELKKNNSAAYVTDFYTEFGCTDPTYNAENCLNICDKNPKRWVTCESDFGMPCYSLHDYEVWKESSLSAVCLTSV